MTYELPPINSQEDFDHRVTLYANFMESGPEYDAQVVVAGALSIIYTVIKCCPDQQLQDNLKTALSNMCADTMTLPLGDSTKVQ